MKNPTYHLFLLYIYFSIFISSINTEDSQETEFYHIIDGSLNGTAKYVSLASISEDVKYLYFTFDFDYHYNSLSSNKDSVYFKLTTPLEFIKKNNPYLTKSVSFIFSEKNWNEIETLDDLKLKKKFWIPTYMIFYQKDNYGNYEYYIGVKKYFNDQKTLVLRVPTLGNTKVDITVENLISLPENVKKFAKTNHFNESFYENNINSGKNNLYSNYYHRYKYKHERTHNNMLEGWAAGLGTILGQIWIAILVLYWLVNKRKKTIKGFAVVVNNDSTNQRNVVNVTH